MGAALVWCDCLYGCFAVGGRLFLMRVICWFAVAGMCFVVSGCYVCADSPRPAGVSLLSAPVPVDQGRDSCFLLDGDPDGS